MKSRKQPTIIGTIADPKLFAPWFKGSSWGNWRVFLKALFGLPMYAQDMRTFTKYTGRDSRPKGIREAWLPVGRRGGKSLIAALVAVFLACFRDYGKYLGPGERITIMVIAADRKQARVVMRYVVGFLEGVAMLESLVERKTQETVDLTNRVTIEVHTTSYRSVRGYTLGAVICDEIAFWRSDDSASPDREIISALRPGMASIPGSLLLAISSPYSRKGMLWQMHSKHYGKDTPVLVWQAPTEAMNPSLDPQIVKEAYEDDPVSAAAEFGAEFRLDIEGIFSIEILENIINRERPLELPPDDKYRRFGFLDTAGGSGTDSMTLGVAHKEGERLILDCVTEVRPPFNPEAVSKEFASIFRRYRVSSVRADRYAGDWPKTQFKKWGVDVMPSKLTKSELYLELIPLINSEQVELPNHKRLISQLCGLERRTSSDGRDSVDHGQHGHDDLANVTAGVLVLCAKKKQGYDPGKIRPPVMYHTPGWRVE